MRPLPRLKISPAAHHLLTRRWLILALVAALAGCAVLLGNRLPLLPQTPAPALPEEPGRAPRLPPAATLTPFQPLAFTPTALPATAGPTPAPRTPVAAPPGAASPRTPLNLWDIDFSRSDLRITLQITPPNAQVNRGKPILISFFPAKTCVFGDHHACVHSYQTESGADILFISVHSGVGGEGQQYRHALEGTGLDQAGATLKQIQANLRALDGAAVTLAQGSRVVRGLVLAVNGRVPAARLENYFNAPIPQALARAAAADPALKPAVNPNQPQLVFETCGWKVKEEPWATGVTSTTASIYLGVVRQGP